MDFNTKPLNQDDKFRKLRGVIVTMGIVVVIEQPIENGNVSSDTSCS
jgi:hypothetical protein